MKTLAAFALLTLPLALCAQMNHTEAATPKAIVPSTTLTVTGLDGKTQSYSPEDLRNMTHLTVKVHNAHTNADESYSGVPVSSLVKRAEPNLTDKSKSHPLMTVLIFEGADKYRIALTVCDIDPSCRNGIAIVADQIDGRPLTADGAFKLILTEDKKPQRWTRNLASITVKSLE